MVGLLMMGMLVFAAVPAAAAPSNDAFAAAVNVPSSTFMQQTNTFGATTETGETMPCAFGGSFGASVWYRMDATATTSITLDTFGSSFDTQLALYQGTALSSLTVIACNDDAPGTSRSRISGAITSGVRYYIQVSGWNGQTGQLRLNAAVPPANDAFANAVELSPMPVSFNGDTTAATTETSEPTPPCGFGTTGTLWYRFTAPNGSQVTVDTLGSTLDTVLAVYSGSSLSTLTTVACSDDVGGGVVQSKVVVAGNGATYYVQVAACCDRIGSFIINASIKLPPANDHFADATVLGTLPNTVTGDTTLGTVEPGEPAPSCASGATKTVWYRFTAPTGARVTLDTSGSALDTVVAVYRGSSVSSLTPAGCNDDRAPGVPASRLVLVADGGTYNVQVTACCNREGAFSLAVTIDIPPTNDAFASAAALGAPGSAAGTTVAASTEPGEPSPACSSGGTATVWYRFTAPAGARVTLDTSGSALDTVVAVYRGSSLSSLSPIGCNDDVGGGATASRLAVISDGGTHHVQVTACCSREGTFTIATTVELPPANDAFANAAALSVPGTTSGTTVVSGVEPGEPVPSCASGAAGTVWYRVTAPAGARVTLDTSGSALDTVVAVYRGSSLPTLSEVGCGDDISAGNTASRVAVISDGGPLSVQVTSCCSREGTFTLAASVELPPANDQFANATSIGVPGTASGTTSLATREAGEPAPSCATSTTRSVWYRFDAPAGARIVLDTTGGSIDTAVAAYRGSTLTTLSQVACNDVAGGGETAIVYGPGTTYVQVSSTAEGAFTLASTITFPPANDDIAAAEAISAIPTERRARTVDATLETGEPQPSCGALTRSAWYRVQLTSTQPVSVSTFGSSFPTMVSVWRGAPGALTEMTCNASSGGSDSSIAGFVAQAGQTYWVQAGSRGAGPGGDLVIRFTNGAALGGTGAAADEDARSIGVDVSAGPAGVTATYDEAPDRPGSATLCITSGSRICVL